MLQVHEVLQLARREHSGGAVARDQPRRSRPLARTGGQQDGAAAHGEPALRARHVESTLAGPAGDRRLGTQLGAGVQGRGDEATGVRRAARDPVQVAYAVPEMVAVTRYPARLALPVEDEDAAVAGQLARRGEPGRSRADDHDVGGDLGDAHVVAPPSASSRVTSAPQ